MECKLSACTSAYALKTIYSYTLNIGNSKTKAVHFIQLNKK